LSRRRLAAAAAFVLLALCCRGAREPYLTYFNGDHSLSLRYPSTWKTEQAAQDGVWYRYFLGPPTGPQSKPAVSVTLLVGPLAGSVDEYAQTYLAGNSLVSSQDEKRQGAAGRSYLFTAPDSATKYALLLVAEAGKVYGLYTQGEAAEFDRQRSTIDEISKSLTLERAQDYELRRNDKFGFAIRMPPSWRATRTFSGGGTFLTQFTSPPLAADANGQTVHAALTLTVEPLGADGSLDGFYQGVRTKLGESFQLLSHGTWKGGYVDVMRTETPVATSRVKRFYRAQNGRGYSLAFEARDDVYHRVSRWCDMIAATLDTGGPPEASAEATR
jgi:hypothetical protein